MVYTKVKAYCDKQGIPVMALEKEAGLSNGTIGGWARENARPSAESVLRVARAMNVTVEWLMENDNAED